MSFKHRRKGWQDRHTLLAMFIACVVIVLLVFFPPTSNKPTLVVEPIVERSEEMVPEPSPVPAPPESDKGTVTIEVHFNSDVAHGEVMVLNKTSWDETYWGLTSSNFPNPDWSRVINTEVRGWSGDDELTELIYVPTVGGVGRGTYDNVAPGDVLAIQALVVLTDGTVTWGAGQDYSKFDLKVNGELVTTKSGLDYEYRAPLR